MRDEWVIRLSVVEGCDCGISMQRAWGPEVIACPTSRQLLYNCQPFENAVTGPARLLANENNGLCKGLKLDCFLLFLAATSKNPDKEMFVGG